MPLPRLRPVLLAASVLLALVLGWLRHSGHFQFLELAARDLFLSLHPGTLTTPPPVTLVLISEADIQRLGNWPLTDAQLTGVLEQILAHHPRAVGLDIYRDLPVPPGTPSLNELLVRESRIIAIEKFPAPGSRGIAPPPALAGTPRVGFSDLVLDEGGMVRRGLLFQTHQGRTGYAFGLRLALKWLAERGIAPRADPDHPGWMRLGQTVIPPLQGNEGGYAMGPPGGYQILLDYRGGPLPFPRFDLATLKDAPSDALRDRIVILGVASESVKDYFATPFAQRDQASGILPGAAIHAHLARQLIDLAEGRDRPERYWNDEAELAWMVAWLVAGLLAGWWLTSTWEGLLVGLAGLALILAASWWAWLAHWWIPLVPGVLGWLVGFLAGAALAAVHRRREQRQLMALFGRQVSPEVARDIWARRHEILEQGRIAPRTLVATVLFTDLKGFTALSERMEARAFFQWLNDYLADFTDTIMAQGGVIDDFAGDGIKANFGVPFEHPGRERAEAAAAARCALALCSRLEALNRHHRARDLPEVAMRIGLHTGPVVAGTLGSAARMKYTTVGVNVNLAARLESLDMVPGPEQSPNRCRILVSGTTARLLALEFHLVYLGKFHLRGLEEPQEVWQIKGEKRPDRNVNRESPRQVRPKEGLKNSDLPRHRDVSAKSIAPSD